MREIKFRAKTVNTGEIVESMTIARGEIWRERDDYFFEIAPNEYVGVIAETISQYTGLKDKTGKDIYELNEINNKFRVVFKFNRYILQSISNSDIFEEIKENGKYEITGEYSPIP